MASSNPLPVLTGTAAGMLGTGWGFPPSFGAGGATVVMVSDYEDIQQSLRILFSTRPGERIMREDFGCALDELMFAPIDHDLVNRLSAMIAKAVARYEPRIQLLDLDVVADKDVAGLLHVNLDYVVRATRSRQALGFPLSLQDGRAPGA